MSKAWDDTNREKLLERITAAHKEMDAVMAEAGHFPGLQRHAFRVKAGLRMMELNLGEAIPELERH